MATNRLSPKQIMEDLSIGGKQVRWRDVVEVIDMKESLLPDPLPRPEKTTLLAKAFLLWNAHDIKANQLKLL